MQPNELEVGKLYEYNGPHLHRATIRYTGKQQNYWGTGYVFQVMRDGWQIGGNYYLNASGPEWMPVLSGVTPKQETTQP